MMHISNVNCYLFNQFFRFLTLSGLENDKKLLLSKWRDELTEEKRKFYEADIEGKVNESQENRDNLEAAKTLSPRSREKTKEKLSIWRENKAALEKEKKVI
jgi:hypothetical protein